VLVRAVLFTLVPVAAAAVSGGVAVLRPPGVRVTSGLQHFAAGVIFAAVAVELLPGVLDQPAWVAVVGFGVGIAVMFGCRAAGERAERRRADQALHGLPVGMLAAIGVDFLVDGVIVGAGFAAGAELGLLLTVALAVEYLFVGLSLSATLSGHASRRTTLLAPVALSALTLVGTVAGAVVLAGASPALLGGVLAFGAVAFMYLATEELLVEAHASGETALGSVGFFVGFLVYLVLHEVVR
jgi:ZIP family zinc transporter